MLKKVRFGRLENPRKATLCSPDARVLLETVDLFEVTFAMRSYRSYDQKLC